jgi:hypothetical protein
MRNLSVDSVHSRDAELLQPRFEPGRQRLGRPHERRRRQQTRRTAPPAHRHGAEKPNSGGSVMARVLSVLLVLSCLGAIANAQTTDPAAGIPPFSTHVTGAVDSLDLASSNIMIRIPVRTKTGKIESSYSLVGNFHVAIVGGSGTPQALSINPDIAGVFELATSTPIYHIVYHIAQGPACGTHAHDVIYTGNSLTDPHGTVHPIPAFETSLYGCQGVAPSVITTVDGSGITVVTGRNPNPSQWGPFYNAAGDAGTEIGNSAATVTDPDGTVLIIAPLHLTGNLEDSLWSTGQPYFLSVVGGDVNNGGNNSYTYTDTSGVQQTFTAQRTSYTLQSNFGCTIAEFPTVARYLITSITTPVGAYQISYEPTPGLSGNGAFGPYSTGRIAKITLPSGGYVQYAYSGGNNGFNCSSTVVPTLTRTVGDGNGHVSTWTYVNSNNSQPGSFTVTETDPANNQTVYTFPGEHQTQAQYFQGPATGTPLKTVVTCYNGNFTQCSSSLRRLNLFIKLIYIHHIIIQLVI